MFCSVNSLLEQRFSRNRWNSVLTKAKWNIVLTDTCSNYSVDCPVGQSSPSFQSWRLSHLFTTMNTNFPQLKHCFLWNSLWTGCAARYFCFILIHIVVFTEQHTVYNPSTCLVILYYKQIFILPSGLSVDIG